MKFKIEYKSIGGSTLSSSTSTSSQLRVSFNDLNFPDNMRGATKVYHLNQINKLWPEINEYLNKNEISFKFNDENLQEAVNLWYNNEEEAKLQHGDINRWDVSRVTNMNNLFSNKLNFNSNISNWNTSNVTNMDHMFSWANLFNQDIGNWNTSNVTNMILMFSGTKLFNKDI